jgi:glycerol-3-phosphate dehydrogenase
LLKNAPHLSRPLALLTPCFSFIESIYYTIGLKMYEWIAGSQNISSSERLSKKEALELIPELKKKRLNSAVLYYDGQLDDARYCLALVQTAVEKGVLAFNYIQANKFVKNEDTGRIKTLLAQDLLTGEDIQIHAKAFINATGPFADHIRKMANSKMKPRIKVSRGAHIVLPKKFLQGDAAILVPKTDDGRVIFMIPWQDHLLVGTTDEEDQLSENPKLEDYERTYLIDYVNRYLETPVTEKDVTSGFAGQRPLLEAKLHTALDSETKSLVRDHEVEIDKRSKLVSIMGGKWTTYRLMAKDTVDMVQENVLKQSVVECTTDQQVLFGEKVIYLMIGRYS